MRRPLLAITVAAALLLAGCGSGSDGDSGTDSLASVTVSGDDTPKVTVKGFSVDKTATEIVTEGTGAEVKSGDTVKARYLAVNGRTGKQLNNSFVSDATISIQLSETATLPGIVSSLKGRKIGDRVLVAVAPKDGNQQEDKASDVKKDDTLIFLFDLIGTVPTIASGTARPLPDDVPQLSVDKDNRPTGFTKSAKTAPVPQVDAPASSYDVIEGTGAVVAAGQTVTVQYFGQVYPDGVNFDSSWKRGAPITNALSDFIPCWQDQLVGHKLGSRVILVCPSNSAYGDAGMAEIDVKPGDTLLFAVDLLDAS